MSKYHRAFRLIADDIVRDEFAQRYRDAWSAGRAIRQNRGSGLPVAETYYEAAVLEHKLKVLSMEPWKELLTWAKARPGLQQQFPKEYAQVRDNAGPPPPPPDPDDFEGHFDNDVAEFYLDAGDLGRLIPLMDANDIQHYTHEFPTGKKVMTIELDGDDGPWVVELGEKLTYWQETQDWINDATDRAHEFFGEPNESEEFWNGVGSGSYLYHATEEDSVASILKNGLEARSATRGLSNRDIGDAVFTVSGEMVDDLPTVLGSYGDAIIRIDIGAMKADGYMPEITGETPVQEAGMAEALAHGIEYEYEASRESDYMDDTIAILGNIPAKYLSLHE